MAPVEDGYARPVMPQTGRADEGVLRDAYAGNARQNGSAWRSSRSTTSLATCS